MMKDDAAAFRRTDGMRDLLLPRDTGLPGVNANDSQLGVYGAPCQKLVFGALCGRATADGGRPRVQGGFINSS